MRIQLLLIEKITELHNILPDYSMGELLYSILRPIKPEETTIGWIREIKDPTFMKAFEKIIKNEKE